MLLSDDVRDLRPAASADLDAEIARLEHSGRALARATDLDAARRLLCAAGALEAGIADALNPEADSFGPAEGAWRAVTLEAARLFMAARQGRDLDARQAAKRFGRALGLAARSPRPRDLDVDAAAGLAPEAYLTAADEFLASSVALPIVILGLRGPGAGLSAALSAGLEAGGRRVESLTVRAHGVVGDRTVRLGERVARRLTIHAAAGGWFLIVGEGPKGSGASFHAAGAALNALGAGDEQIVLFPSRLADPAGFSPAAREDWNRRRKVTATAAPRLPGLYAAE